MKNYIKTFIKFILGRQICIKTNSIIKERCELNFNTVLEGNNVINKNVNISNSTLGYGTYIGENSKIYNTSIGRYCSISENVKVIVGRHPTKKFVSTHPAFFSDKKQAGFTYVNETIFQEQRYSDRKHKRFASIGNDVWIGANVTILDGSIIGDGAIVAAGAVVVGNLEPYYIYGGVPAKKIGERFSSEEREFLKKYKWWNRDKQWIEKNVTLFSDITLFMENYTVECLEREE